VVSLVERLLITINLVVIVKDYTVYGLVNQEKKIHQFAAGCVDENTDYMD